jgi:hypothetical protein
MVKQNLNNITHISKKSCETPNDHIIVNTNAKTKMLIKKAKTVIPAACWKAKTVAPTINILVVETVK